MKFSTVVISGVPGSGKGALAKKLSEKLGWKIFSKGELFREMHKKKHPAGEVPFEEFWKSLSKEEQEEMDRKALEVLKSGNAIGDFRYAKSCEGIDALFIYVTAELEVRANRAMNTGKYAGKSVEEIKRILQAREEDEVKIGKELFGQDYDYRNLGDYNLILDSGDLKIEEELAIALGTLEGKDRKTILKETVNLKV
ncbi:MAG: nucleoside monophosphate kinase [archaeon]